MNRHADTNAHPDYSRQWWLEPGFKRHPQVLYPDQLGERVDLYAQRASVEHYEKLARQARRKVKARAFIGYAVMVGVAVAIGIMLAVGHS